MTTTRIKLNRRLILATIVTCLALFAAGLLLLSARSDSGDVKQSYDQQAVLTIAKQLTDIRGAIDQRSPGLNWTESKRCERYPPISIADEESFACFVAFKSEVVVTKQGDIDKLVGGHVASLGDLLFVSDVKAYQMPAYVNDSNMLQGSEFDKPAQMGGLSFKLVNSPNATCGFSYELIWHNETYMKQVLECNADSTGEFF